MSANPVKSLIGCPTTVLDPLKGWAIRINPCKEAIRAAMALQAKEIARHARVTRVEKVEGSRSRVHGAPFLAPICPACVYPCLNMQLYP